jgi:hypothetical protein
MKKRLAITAGILVPLAVLALFGYFRVRSAATSRDYERSEFTAVKSELRAAASPSTSPLASRVWKCPRCGFVQLSYYDPKHYSVPQCIACGVTLSDAGAATPPAASTNEASPPAGTPNLNLRSGGGGGPPPAPSASPTTGSSLSDVDAALKKLDWGQMAFDVPEKLRLEQTALIHLLISPAHTAEQLTAAIREQTKEPVKIESARIQISGMMEAKLVGSAFDIRSITPEEPQMVSRTEPTEWKWEVRPKQSGQQSLHLTLNAIVRFEDKERPRVVRTFDRIIQVDVTPGASYSVWIWPVVALAAALALLGLVVWLYKKRLGRRRNAVAQSLAQMETTGHDATLDLFLSYSRRDEKRVLPIADRLRSSGLSVWIDQGGIDGATLWAQEITDAIRRAKVCVLFGSASSYGSSHVIREVSLACEERKPILPLQLDHVETPSAMRYQLAGIQQIALYQGDPEANFQLILRALARLGAQPIPAP